MFTHFFFISFISTTEYWCSAWLVRFPNPFAFGIQACSRFHPWLNLSPRPPLTPSSPPSPHSSPRQVVATTSPWMNNKSRIVAKKASQRRMQRSQLCFTEWNYWCEIRCRPSREGKNISVCHLLPTFRTPAGKIREIFVETGAPKFVGFN